MTPTQISLDAKQGLGIVQTVLPLLESMIPQVAAGSALANLIISGGEALVPLIASIPTGELISVEEQAALMARNDDIRSGNAFTGPEWQKSPLASKPAPDDDSGTGQAT